MPVGSFVTMWPGGARPTTSSINFGPGAIVANACTVGLAPIVGHGTMNVSRSCRVTTSWMSAATSPDESLGLGVVGEGIEDRYLWDRMGQLGCDVGQGYPADGARRNGGAAGPRLRAPACRHDLGQHACRLPMNLRLRGPAARRSGGSSRPGLRHTSGASPFNARA